VVFQFQLAKKLDGLPITRGYIEEREGELAGKSTPMKVTEPA
jgi:cyclopropane-fatty-acyl-phospholipid synthase